MKSITQRALLTALDNYLSGYHDFAYVREMIYQFYEGEESIQIDESTEQLLAVLAPYLEYEEAFGDFERNERMRRVRDVLVSQNLLTERIIFALEFTKICELTKKLLHKNISQRVYEEQIQKLSPTSFDHNRIKLWAQAHIDEQDINLHKLI